MSPGSWSRRPKERREKVGARAGRTTPAGQSRVVTSWTHRFGNVTSHAHSQRGCFSSLSLALHPFKKQGRGAVRIANKPASAPDWLRRSKSSRDLGHTRRLCPGTAYQASQCPSTPHLYATRCRLSWRVSERERIRKGRDLGHEGLFAYTRKQNDMDPHRLERREPSMAMKWDPVLWRGDAVALGGCSNGLRN